MKDTAFWVLRSFVFLKPHKKWVVLSIITSVLSTVLGIIVPLVIQNLIDEGLALNYPEFIRYLCYSGGLMGVGAVIVYLSSYAVSRYSAYFERDYKNFITRCIQELPICHISKYRTGDLVSRIDNDILKVSDLVRSITSLVTQPLLLIGAVTFMIILNWKLMIACTIFIPISSLIFDKVNKPIKKHSYELMKDTAKANSMLQDVIGGIYILKAFNLKETLFDKFHAINLDIQEKSMKIERLNAYLTPIFLMLRLTPQLILPLYGRYLMLKGEI